MTKATLGKLALSVAVAVVGLGFFVKSTLGSAYQHKKVDELGADLAHWQGKPLTVYGSVVPQTVREAVVDQETQRSFVLESGDRRIRVFHLGPKPDVFKDRADAAVTGRVVPAADKRALAELLGVVADAEGAYVIDATELSAKCPSRYTGALVNKDLNTKFEP